MKKLILPFVALLLCMVACQKEDLNLLTLEVEHFASDAKMHIDEWDFAVWDDGDTVYLNENPRRVTVDNANHRATISAQDIYSSYYASYPYVTTVNGLTSARSYTISLPEVQTYRENSQGKQVVAAPMFAWGTFEDPTLKFRNLGSVLEVKVLNNTYDMLRVHSISVTADNQNLWGNKSFTERDINDGLVLNSLSNGGNTVTLECVGVEVPAEGKVFYIALPAITDAHLTVKVDDGYGIYTLAQTTNTATFARNTLHQVPFTASESNCRDYALRPQPSSNTIKYTATSKLTGFEENTTVWGKTLVSHTYDATSKKGTITFNSDITEIPDRAFEGTPLSSIKLPESVERIERFAFIGCGSLASVSMPGVKTVGEWAFGECPALTTVNLPSVTRIDANAFSSTGIKTITFGSNLGSLGIGIFGNCETIEHVYCKAQNVPTSDIVVDPTQSIIGDDTKHCFTGIHCSPILHVPSGSGYAYAHNNIWRIGFGVHVGPGSRILEDCPTD